MKSAQAAFNQAGKKTRSRRTSRPAAHPEKLKVPALRFSPYAWAKLLYLRDRGDTEVGGFGVTCPDDLLLVDDVRLVRQRCTWASVRFDDAAVADFFDGEVDAGREPEEFGRLWLHTHPGRSAQPSEIDEQTFARCFGPADWSAMFILARGGQTYARLRFGVGPGGAWEIPVEVDFHGPFPATDQPAWEQEYAEAVEIVGDPLGAVFPEALPAWELGAVEAETGSLEDGWDDLLSEDFASLWEKEEDL